VPDYRLYFLDARGHIRRIVAFDCDSDEQAIQLVTDKHGARPKMELWTYRRKVKIFPTTDGNLP
jgi:hypothetical protein